MTFSHKFCVAPMMDWTDRHDRMFLRLFSSQALLYTEMVTTGALIHGDADYLLQHQDSEQPVALQLGGSDPKQLGLCAKMGEDAGYKEINLNVGCPSDRVKSGFFGACLMADASLVAEGVQAMRQEVSIPVTVKCRIGIDDLDTPEFLHNFVKIVSQGGCETFIIHARKAILSGLSPKENREIPPLIYERVYDLKKAMPQLKIVVNGGIKTYSEIDRHLEHVDGVMMGREAYQNPYILSQIDKRYFDVALPVLPRVSYLEKYLPYIESELEKGTPLQHMSRHILGLFKGEKGGKQFRRHLSENCHKKNANICVIKDAIAYVN